MCDERCRDTDVNTIPVIWIADHADHELWSWTLPLDIDNGLMPRDSTE